VTINNISINIVNFYDNKMKELKDLKECKEPKKYDKDMNSFEFLKKCLLCHYTLKYKVISEIMVILYH
jgi:hypothetical protein